jgi:hypothetical protein
MKKRYSVLIILNSIVAFLILKQRFISDYRPEPEIIEFEKLKEYNKNLFIINVNRVLVGKGLLAYNKKNGFEIPDTNFSNFINNTAHTDDISIEISQHRKRTWRTFKLLLFIIVVNIIAFLLLTQRNLFSQLYKLIIPIAGFIGLYPKLSGNSTSK